MIEGPTQLVVLDTSVVSILFRDQSELATQYKHLLRGRRTVVSFQTIEEVLFGAFKANWGERRRNGLARHFANFEIIDSSLELTQISAKLRADQELKGRGLATADAWIAATALMLKCPLATRDRDFSGVDDLELLRPQGTLLDD